LANRILSILAVALFLMGAAAPSSTEIEGELQVIIKDYPTRAEYEYSVKDAKGQRHKLKMPASYKHDKNLQSGQKVKVKGKRSRAIGGEFEVEALEVSEVIIALPAWLTRAPNPTLVMCVSWPNQPAPCTAATAKTFFEQTINPFFIGQSQGAMRLVGIKDPTGPGDFVAVTVPDGTPVCDGSLNAAMQAAKAQGYNTGFDPAFPQGYFRFVYILPGQPCAWNGLGTVGWYGGFTIVNGEISCRVICHELGHNLGLAHSRSEQQCMGYGCPFSEYGDFTDIMGNTPGGIMGGYDRDRLGWVNQPNTPQIPTIAQSGDYTIEALDAPGSGIKGIKIASTDPTDSAGGIVPQFVYVTLRQGRGQVFVHRGYEYGSGGWLQGYNNGETGNWSLEPGEVFQLAHAAWLPPPTIPISIRTKSISGATAIISVQLQSGGMVPNAPSFLTVN